MVKRAHYDLGMLTSRALPKGEPYAALRHRFVMFVTAHDLFGDGLPMHRFPPTIDDDGMAEGSGIIIFANASYGGDDEFGMLMHDIRCKDVSKMHAGPLKELAVRLKNPFGKEKKVMSGVLRELEEEWRAEAREEAKQELSRKLADMVRNVMKVQGWSLEKTLAALNLSQEDSLSVMALL